MKLIVGLGNPEKKYDGTRHNVGFMFLDYLHENWQSLASFSKWTKSTKFQAEVAEGFASKEKIILAKPTTYMNNSGYAIAALANFYNIETEDIIVIHDELDIPFGEYKCQLNRSSAGHNGVSSIIEHLGNSQNFWRIRIGIGKKSSPDQSEHVLDKFNIMERLALTSLKKNASEELKKLLKI
jgi:peptidyl-tRNA hydrolase, PTH1 family